MNQLTKEPYLTVITVVKNDLSGLILTTNSILEQKGIVIQHVIVDGGSTDGSHEYSLIHSDIHIDSKNDGGIYFGMKRGAEVAEGDFLLFLNSGDFLGENRSLARVLNQLEEQSAEWGFGPVIELTSRRTEIITKPPKVIDLQSIAYRKTFVPFPTSVYRTEFYKLLGGIQTKFRIASDFELILKAIKTASPIYWETPLVKFAAGGISYKLAPLSWKEEHEIRKVILQMNWISIFISWLRVKLRISKWIVGKILDFIYERGFIKGKHWRDIRGDKLRT